MMVVNILLVLNVSAYYSTIAEGAILMLAVLAGSLTRDSPLATHLRGLGAGPPPARAGTLPSRLAAADRRLRIARRPRRARPTLAALPRPATPRRSATRCRPMSASSLVVIVTQFWLGDAAFSWNYWNSLLVLSSFLAVLALGQGAVILTGGLDLSVPWTIGLSGILLAGIVNGSDAALLYALPARPRRSPSSSASPTASASSGSASRRSS